jgi:flagellar basal-body rod protein FlgF
MGISIRPTGMTHAAAALRNLELRQDVLANNLANVSTPGFKGEQVFAEMLGGDQAPIVRSRTDFRSGAITSTGAPLDLAMSGTGFFVVDTPNGERLTRGGSLQLDDARRLVTADGHQVLGEDDEKGGTRGPVMIPANARDVQINRSGAVIVDGVQIARLRCESASSDVMHEAGGLFRAAESPARIPIEDRTIRQGAIEESNVGSLESMVDLISVQRAYSSVQKVMTTIDSALGIAASEIGKPA